MEHFVLIVINQTLEHLINILSIVGSVVQNLKRMGNPEDWEELSEVIKE